MTVWRESYRASPSAARIADRHYNRHAIGSNQFVPPGRCYVLQHTRAVWVTSWPLPEFVRHRWAGAWVNSLFRNEGAGLSSELITQAVALTRARWDPPPLGIVTFVDARRVRHKRDPGRCYRKAGWSRVGVTLKDALIVFQLLPADMPAPDFSLRSPLLEAAHG